MSGQENAVRNRSQDRPIIAILDDDESVCYAIKRLVRSLGMEAYTFNSGGQFMEFLEGNSSHRFDCIIIDVQMPGLSGFDIQERLKQRDEKLPVIFITSQDEVKIRELALEAGAIDFLRKPFAAETLIKSLRAAVQTCRQQITAPSA